MNGGNISVKWKEGRSANTGCLEVKICLHIQVKTVINFVEKTRAV